MTTVEEFMAAAPARLEGNTPWASLVLPSGHVALIDETDLPLINQFKWHARRGRRTVYVQTHGSPANGRRRSYLHRLLLSAPPGLLVDHRNLNGLDNRRDNLRLCTPVENNANQQAQINNRSGYRGVHQQTSTTSPWRARIQINGKTRHLGCFADAWDAAQAYNTAATEVYGEFALLNVRLP